MSYSTTAQLLSNSLRSLAILTFITGTGILTAQAQETPPPPKQATSAEVAECEEEHMKREGIADLGGSQYRDKIRDLCNKSVHGADKAEAGKEPATNDYYFSGDNNGFVYELNEECQQIRIQEELIFICPEGKYKPTIRNNQSGFMPYLEPVEPIRQGEKP
ncbi:hypothetical protein PsAD46_00347 [Pseudovibrio sp. Ad46]|uniref:hypothetical protein n=1 Tax=Pseudovibrio sp. Ad46 TaxID=989432 RepID=UPI0007AE4A62|nr:hypothetical protein [Pseudovibrio sp. Ad46]KZK95343.1 hypothetical protein PsAD46_00347 [Pseudovibrio sp. Ad46]